MRRYRALSARAPLDDAEAFSALGIDGGRLITGAILGDLLASPEPRLVLIASPRCRPSLRATPIIVETLRQAEILDDLTIAASGHPSQEHARRLAGERFAYPSLLVIQDGMVRDLHRGAEQDEEMLRQAVRNLLARNGFLGDEAPVFLHDFSGRDDHDVRRNVHAHRGLQSADFSLANLRGIEISGASFSGSSFRGANLRDVSLRDAILAHADFSGADLTGADLSGALWSSTICPDGTSSDDNAGTCEGTFIGNTSTPAPATASLHVSDSDEEMARSASGDEGPSRIEIEALFVDLLRLYREASPFAIVLGADQEEMQKHLTHLAHASRRWRSRLEDHFERSGGDREVFGWMTVRVAQENLTAACMDATAEVPDAIPAERHDEMRANLLQRSLPWVDYARRVLEMTLVEGSGGWADLAAEVLPYVGRFQNDTSDVCGLIARRMERSMCEGVDSGDRPCAPNDD